jgi:hypothetical protein
MTPHAPPPAKLFYCYICKETSTVICVYCTKDTCGLHLCERCKRCTDCCSCYLDQQKRR